MAEKHPTTPRGQLESVLPRMNSNREKWEFVRAVVGPLQGIEVTFTSGIKPSFVLRRGVIKIIEYQTARDTIRIQFGLLFEQIGETDTYRLVQSLPFEFSVMDCEPQLQGDTIMALSAQDTSCMMIIHLSEKIDRIKIKS